jgi:hypothetical protein
MTPANLSATVAAANLTGLSGALSAVSSALPVTALEMTERITVFGTLPVLKGDSFWPYAISSLQLPPTLPSKTFPALSARLTRHRLLLFSLTTSLTDLSVGLLPPIPRYAPDLLSFRSLLYHDHARQHNRCLRCWRDLLLHDGGIRSIRYVR